jgi:GNAT superfamily N-acetyltransferase
LPAPGAGTLTDVVVRRGDKLDVPFLRSLLAFAYGWHVAAFDTFDISIYQYVDAWGRDGDAALIATASGHPVGAAWYRLFPASRPGFGFVDEKTPEMTVTVIPARQGQGIGQQLVAALLDRAREEGYPAVSISVQRGHADEALLRDAGFEQVAEHGDTLTLRRAL